MIEAKEKTIGATTYRVTPFGARKGRTVLFLLSKLLGGTLAALGEGSLAAAVNAWATGAREEDFDAVCKALENGTQILMPVSGDGKSVPMELSLMFDQHFAGKYDEMVQWLIFALEANFASFFNGSIAAGFLTKTKAAATEPATSTA